MSPHSSLPATSESEVRCRVCVVSGIMLGTVDAYLLEKDPTCKFTTVFDLGYVSNAA